MGNEYESDDFDMEQVYGADNPDDLEGGYDSSAEGRGGAPGPFAARKPYRAYTVVETVDRKSGKRIRKAVFTDSTKPRYVPKRKK